VSFHNWLWKSYVIRSFSEVEKVTLKQLMSEFKLFNNTLTFIAPSEFCISKIDDSTPQQININKVSLSDLMSKLFIKTQYNIKVNGKEAEIPCTINSGDVVVITKISNV
jgi:hypothetical protein